MSGKLISNKDERTTAPSPPFIFTQLLLERSDREDLPRATRLFLPLTAEERTKSRHYFEAQLDSPEEQECPLASPLGTSDQSHSQLFGVYLRLSRGTVLRHNACLTTDGGGAILRVMAKPEPVMTAIASTPLDLLKAAYHLGNRHVELEVNLNYLRFSPDPVLKQMVERMGLSVTEAVLPFHPEAGAYASPSAHSSHHHSHHTH